MNRDLGLHPPTRDFKQQGSVTKLWCVITEQFERSNWYALPYQSISEAEHPEKAVENQQVAAVLMRNIPRAEEIHSFRQLAGVVILSPGRSIRPCVNTLSAKSASLFDIR